MYLCSFVLLFVCCTLLLSRCEATLHSIMSESSCTDQVTLCLVIIFKAWWSAASWAGVRFLGSLRQKQTHTEIQKHTFCQLSQFSLSVTWINFYARAVPFFFLRGTLTTSFLFLFLFRLFPPTTSWFLDAGSMATWKTKGTLLACFNESGDTQHEISATKSLLVKTTTAELFFRGRIQ